MNHLFKENRFKILINNLILIKIIKYKVIKELIFLHLINQLNLDPKIKENFHKLNNFKYQLITTAAFLDQISPKTKIVKIRT